uniref:Uncharacterized protein n=1 Tax=Riptortus pedestris TaxID=329032 RepID=R4WRV0_RIPPE|nr:unknown secreted protein [Riptortus pedestris]
MSLLPLFILTVATFSQCNGDFLRTFGIEQSLVSILESKIESLKDIQKDVEHVLEKTEKRKEASSYSNERLLGLEGVPEPCLNLVSNGNADQPCPDLNVLAAQLKVVILDLTQLIADGVNAFNATFSSSTYECKQTYNPFTALRCFLRAFRAAYNSLSDLKSQIITLKEEAQKLYDEYTQYSHNCANHTEAHLKLISLCKNIHDVNSV